MLLLPIPIHRGLKSALNDIENFTIYFYDPENNKLATNIGYLSLFLHVFPSHIWLAAVGSNFRPSELEELYQS